MFEGFAYPESDFTRIPNEFMESVLSQITSLAELKVILYIMRHTWGFQEYEQYKKFTVDELMNGRKRRDGTRLDNGTGLSESGVKLGSTKALEHGFLECEIDDTDMGRIEKRYRLKMWACDEEK